MKPVTFALPKGRLGEQTVELLSRAGVDCSVLQSETRKLILENTSGLYRFLLVKPADVPAYVYYGAADLGVVGRDTLLEENLPLYEMLDLGFGACKLAVAGLPGALQGKTGALRVATKYPNIARRYFEPRGMSLEIIKLNGSVELGPLAGLSDVIVDIVESGRTLRANGLEVLEEVCPVSARLVVNRVSLKTRPEIERLLADIAAVLPPKEGITGKDTCP